MKEKHRSSPEIRILLAEDNHNWQQLVDRIVTELGGTLVLTVDTLEEALAAIVLMEKLQIDLAILGGNLGAFEDGNPDAVAMLEAMAVHAPTVKTVGLSGDTIPGADVDLGKQNVDQLETTIFELFTEPETTQE